MFSALLCLECDARRCWCRDRCWNTLFSVCEIVFPTRVDGKFGALYFCSEGQGRSKGNGIIKDTFFLEFFCDPWLPQVHAAGICDGAAIRAAVPCAGSSILAPAAAFDGGFTLRFSGRAGESIHIFAVAALGPSQP